MTTWFQMSDKVGEVKRAGPLAGVSDKKADAGMDAHDARRLFDLYPDFPKPGVSFWGLTKLLAASRTEQPDLVKIRATAIEHMAKQVEAWGATKLACLDSRGYLLGGLIAGKLLASASGASIGLVPVMKRGKLPETKSCHGAALVSPAYFTEYSRNEGLVIATGAISDADRVVLVDDLLATGGTLVAAARMIQAATKAKVVGALCLIEVTGLGGGGSDLKQAGQELGRMALAGLKVPCGVSFRIPAGSTTLTMTPNKRLGELVTGTDLAMAMATASASPAAAKPVAMDIDPPLCRHNKPSMKRTVRKEGERCSLALSPCADSARDGCSGPDKGRSFFVCSVYEEPCSFNHWEDDKASLSAAAGAAGTGAETAAAAVCKQVKVETKGDFYECKGSKPVIVLCWPTMQATVDRMLQARPGVFEQRSINWNFFPDETPDFSFPADLENRDVVFVGSAFNLKCWSYQLWIMKVIGDQRVKSFFMCLPFLPTGTMEIVPKEGVLATAQTMATDFESMTPTKSGPPELLVFDFHALPIYHYFNAQKVHVKRGLTASSTLIDAIKRMPDMPDPAKIVLVLPDGGAEKRFASHFVSSPGTVVCIKKRVGDKRQIDICREPDFDWTQRPLLLRDDLVQSGSTLVECAQLLRKRGATLLYAFVTHAVFPKRSYENFTAGGKYAGLFTKFFVTDSIPETTNELLGHEPFCVLPLAADISRHVLTSLGWTPSLPVVPMCAMRAMRSVRKDEEDKALAAAAATTKVVDDGVAAPAQAPHTDSRTDDGPLRRASVVSPSAATAVAAAAAAAAAIEVARMASCSVLDSNLELQYAGPVRHPSAEGKGDSKSTSVVPEASAPVVKERYDKLHLLGCLLKTHTAKTGCGPLKVFVASTSPHKLQAVRIALSRLLVGGVETDDHKQSLLGPALAEFVQIHGVSVPSGVPEQPFDDETTNGARNRMENLKLAVTKHKTMPAGLYVAMENGFDSTECGDFACVVVTSVRDCGGEPDGRQDNGHVSPVGSIGMMSFSGKSDIVKVPVSIGQSLVAVRQHVEDGGTNTIGDIVRLWWPARVDDTTNWQALFHPQGLDRVAILAQTLERVLLDNASSVVCELSPVRLGGGGGGGGQA